MLLTVLYTRWQVNLAGLNLFYMRHIDLLIIHRTEAGHTGREVAQNEPGAYELFIRKDGTVDWALSQEGFDLGFELKGAHAAGYNSRSIGIGVFGCFDEQPEGKPLPYKPRNLHPTQAQLDSLELLCVGLSWWIGRNLHIAGHTELPGSTRFQGKRCPGRNLDMNALRAKTRQTLPPV